MSKLRLLLFRHAKSDWDGDSESDHERDLNDRGRETAAVMGRLLALAGQEPDVAIASTALRARRTLDLASEAGSWSCERRETREFYESTPERVLDVVRGEPEGTQSLLLVGHEPTSSELAGSLIARNAALRFPTAAIARIDFGVDRWQDVDFGDGELVWLLQPKFFTKGAFGRVLRSEPETR